MFPHLDPKNSLQTDVENVDVENFIESCPTFLKVPKTAGKKTKKKQQQQVKKYIYHELSVD